MGEKKDVGEIVSVPRAVLDRLHGAVALMQDGSNAKGLAIVQDVLAEVGECRSPDSLTQERDALREIVTDALHYLSMRHPEDEPEFEAFRERAFALTQRGEG